MKRRTRVFSQLTLAALMLLPVLQANSQEGQPKALLTVKQIMNAMITPMTATIWGAYQLQSDAEWQTVENAALNVIAAGNLLMLGGAGNGEMEQARETEWINYNRQMIDAAQLVLVAVTNRDEEALSAAGNDALYPPCESCHQQYQTQ